MSKRIWTPVDLAEYFGFSITWVYRYTSPKAEDPIPRCAGIGRLRFDTQSPAFQAWLDRHGGGVDRGRGLTDIRGGGVDRGDGGNV